MTIDLRLLNPQPKRLGQCGGCAYRDTGSPAVCYACAKRDLTPLPTGSVCPICQHANALSGACGNPVCNKVTRGFWKNRAIATRAGVLEAVANRFKFDNERGWALILARLLVGYMDSDAAAFRSYDLIIPTPAWTGRGASRDWDHALEVVRAANDAAGGRWPFRVDPVIIRTGSVTPMKGKKAAERRRIAEEELRPKLKVVDAAAVDGKRVLVYDDIFTDGSTLREVGLALMAKGATRVGGVSLMRQLLAAATLAKSQPR